VSSSGLRQRLAAILAADAAGYSRLMAADERATVEALDAARAVFRNQIEAFQGRVIDMAGDSVLAVFDLASAATTAARAIQEELEAASRGRPAERRMRFRIGVHLGEIIEKADGTVYGDGVNVAARIQGLAEPGGVALSDEAHRLVRDRLLLDWRDGGEHTVKNIARPVRIWCWSPGPAPAPAPAVTPVPPAEGSRALPLPDKPSIAVLAFQNMSGDPEQEYFSDGITEDIITNLSKYRGFFVIARNSSFTYKGQAVDVTRVGRELGVRYVLEGSVRKAGRRVRITAQLVDATSGSHLWAEKYDRDLTDLFAMQDEITREIVGSLAPQMLDTEMQRARRKDPQALDAWELAIRAQWHLARLTREDNAEALRLATESTRLNSSTTAGLNIAAFAHIYQAVYGWSASPAQSFVAAHEAARRAVAIDARDEVAQTALGSTEVFMGQHDSAVARLRDAVELNPNFTWAHGDLGLALAFAGKAEEAVGPFNEAVRLSPRDPFCFLWLYLLGFATFLDGRSGEALEHLERSLRLNPSVPGPYRLRAACLSELGRMEEARAALAEFLRFVPGATIASMRAQLPLKNPDDFERYARALRRIGLPE
jgi:TolB-like protein/class 3 adenylate cyclase/Tfp pilus assembly protein PilF